MNVLRHIVWSWRCELRCWCVGDKALCGPTHVLTQRRFSVGEQMEAREVTCCNFWLITRVYCLCSPSGHLRGPGLMTLLWNEFTDTLWHWSRTPFDRSGFCGADFGLICWRFSLKQQKKKCPVTSHHGQMCFSSCCSFRFLTTFGLFWERLMD